MSRLPSLSVDSSRVKQLVHYGMKLSHIGQALHEMGMGFKALQQYDIALELNPNSPIVFHRKGLLYFSKQQYIHAIRCYEQALQQPNYCDVYYDKANAHLALGQVDKAIENYMKALAHFPNKPCILYQLGVAHYQKKNVVTALKFLASSLTIEPNSIPTIQKQGDIYYDLKMYRKALRHYEKIIKLDGLNYKAHYSKVYFEMDLKEKAQAQFDKCVILQPSYSLPYFNLGKNKQILGVLRSQKGEWREAIKFFKECLKRNPNNSKARYELGRSFQALGQFEKALQSYSKCPESHEVIFNQGVIQQSMKMYHKAQELFKRAIFLKKDKMDYWYHLGLNYFHMDNHLKMADSFEKVIGLGGAWVIDVNQNSHPAIVYYQNKFIQKPTSFIEFYKQARAFCLVQQFDRAIQSFLKAIEADPKFKDAKLELAKVYENKQQYKEAIIIYKQLDDVKALQQLSTLCLHLKLYQGTIYTINKILSNFPQNLDALHNKGLAYQGIEQYQLAIQCFDEILKLQPSNAEAIFQKGINSNYEGVAYKNLQEKERAEIQFQKLLNYSVDSELILLLQGHCHLHLNNIQQAICSYEKAISMNKDFSDAHFGLGFAYYSKQEYLLAIKVYKQYLFQSPKSKQFLLALSQTLQKLGKTKSALQKLDQILAEDSQHNEAIHFKAIIHYETKNFKEAFMHFQLAIKLKPRHNQLLKFVYNS